MNHTKNDIYTRIHTVLVEQFEMDADSISMDAKLRDDLDIDSIDAVDPYGRTKILHRKETSRR